MTKKTEKEVSTRNKILDAAFTLFSAKGIKDISMREIAEACGITKPVIYYYFKDKDDLCYEMVKGMTIFQDCRLEEYSKESNSFGEFLERVFEAYFDSKKNKQIVSFMMHLHSYVPSHAELLGRLKNLKDTQKDIMKAQIAKEIKEGKIDPAMKDTLVHLIMAITLHMVLHKGENQIKFKSSFSKDMTNAILRAVEYKGEIK